MNSPSILEPSIDFEPSEIDRLNQGVSTLLPRSFDGHQYDRRRPSHHKYRHHQEDGEDDGGAVADDDDDPAIHSIKLDDAELARLDTLHMLADADFQAPSSLYGDKSGKERKSFIAKARDSSYVERVRRGEEGGGRVADENLKPVLSSLRQSVSPSRGKAHSSPHTAHLPAVDVANPFRPSTADEQSQTPARRYPEPMLSPPETAAGYAKHRTHDAVIRQERDKIIDELQHMHERRIEVMQRRERERIDALEREYKGHLARVQKDLEEVLKQQAQVEHVKKDIAAALEAEIAGLKARLEEERRGHASEREELHATIARLRTQIEELRKAKREGSFLLDHDDRQRLKRSRDYEQRIAQMRVEHDTKIAALVRQFEQEKQSAMEILKTRIRSEINLIIPHIKEQCKASYTQAVARSKLDAQRSVEAKYESIMRALREEHRLDKTAALRDLKARYELERRDWQQRVRERYELKLMQARNDCERQILARLKSR